MNLPLLLISVMFQAASALQLRFMEQAQRADLEGKFAYRDRAMPCFRAPNAEAIIVMVPVKVHIGKELHAMAVDARNIVFTNAEERELILQEIIRMMYFDDNSLDESRLIDDINSLTDEKQIITFIRATLDLLTYNELKEKAGNGGLIERLEKVMLNLATEDKKLDIGLFSRYFDDVRRNMMPEDKFNTQRTAMEMEKGRKGDLLYYVFS